MKRLTRCMLIGAAVLVGASAPALGQELSLEAVGAYGIVGDEAIFGVNDDDRTAYFELSVGYEVYENLFVFGEYRVGGEHASLFGSLDVDLQTHAARVGVKYAYPLLRWLHPYVRAGVGSHWGDIDLEAARQTYDDTAFGLGAFVGGGLELVLYFGQPQEDGKVSLWDHLGVGLVNDYGYSFGPTYELDELVAENGAGTGSVDLGEVDLSGFTWRLGFTFRYQF